MGAASRTKPSPKTGTYPPAGYTDYTYVPEHVRSPSEKSGPSKQRRTSIDYAHMKIALNNFGSSYQSALRIT